MGVYTSYPCDIHGEYSADYKRCSVFYKCDNFRFVEFRCPGNLKWNQGKRRCDWVCDKGEGAQGGHGGSGGGGEGGEGEGNNNDKEKGDELAYVIENGGDQNGVMKTTENLVYAPTTTTPAPTTPLTTPTRGATPSRVTGATELSGQVCFKGGAYLPDLGDCSVVYQCVAGSLIKLFCRNGLFWNHMKQVCLSVQ